MLLAPLRPAPLGIVVQLRLSGTVDTARSNAPLGTTKKENMRNFKRDKVWELSHQLVLRICRITSAFPDSEKYAMFSQMRRAVYFIPSNFAEDSGRKSEKEFNRFIQISLG